MNLFTTYWMILQGLRRRAIAVVLFEVAAGTLEASALLTLVPVLNRLLHGTQRPPAPLRYMELFGDDPGTQLLVALLSFGLIGAGSAACRFVAEGRMLALRADLERSLRGRLSGALLEMSWPAFLRLRLGDLNKALVAEGFQINLGAYAFLGSIASLLVAGVFFATSFLLSAQLTLFTLLFSALGWLFYRCMSRRAAAHAKRLSSIQSSIGAKVSEVFNNLKFFHGSGKTAAARRETERLYQEYRSTYIGTHKYSIFTRLFLELAAVIFVISFLSANYFVFHQSPAALLVFLSLFYRLAPRLLAVHEGLFSARAYSSYWFTWLERLQLTRTNKAVRFGSRAPVYARELQFKDVSFAFDHVSLPVLGRLDLTIAQGECLAIVGPSGSGKTTILDLALGLLSPTKGTVLLDGVPLTEIDIDAWRSKVGLVTQEAPVFFGSVFDNISWDEPLDRRRAIAAAELAHAREFIDLLPDGFDTPIGEKGATLSGGQRQRLAIARALYRNPLLLILDEATSALDGESEAQVQSALRGLKGTLAILLVSHRLKSLEIADRILLLENGCVVEEGGWRELITAPESRFRQMALLQGIMPGRPDGETALVTPP